MSNKKNKENKIVVIQKGNKGGILWFTKNLNLNKNKINKNKIFVVSLSKIDRLSYPPPSTKQSLPLTNKVNYLSMIAYPLFYTDLGSLLRAGGGIIIDGVRGQRLSRDEGRLLG